MINEYKEFLEYTRPYSELDVGDSVWGRLTEGVFKGIGLERALTIIARGFLFHDFDKKGKISPYNGEIDEKRRERAENYLKYWLTGEKKFIENESGYTPCSFVDYLQSVLEASQKKEQEGKDKANNKKGLKNNIEKINEYLDLAHKEKIELLLMLWDKYNMENEEKSGTDTVNILNRIELLARNANDKKDKEDKKSCKAMSKYFSSSEELIKSQYHLYNRFYYFTQYKNPMTYGKNYNLKSIVLAAYYEGMLSQQAYFKVSTKALDIIMEAMISEKGKVPNAFLWQWVVFIYAAAYCKSRVYQTDGEFTYHPVVLSLFESWPKNDGMNFTNLFNKDYNCGKYGVKKLICQLKYCDGNEGVKIAVNKEILDEIEFIDSYTEDTDEYIVFEDCGIGSYTKVSGRLNEFRKRYKNRK